MFRRRLSVAALVCASLFSSVARAEVLFIENLLPKAVVDRIDGSGIRCRSIGPHKLAVAVVKWKLGGELSLRAGFGVARERSQAFLPEEGGVATLAGVSYALWRRAGLTMAVEVTAARVAYQDDTVMDGSVLLTIRGR